MYKAGKCNRIYTAMCMHECCVRLYTYMICLYVAYDMILFQAPVVAKSDQVCTKALLFSEIDL